MANAKKSFIAAVVLIVLAGSFAYFLRYSRVRPDHGPDFALIPMQLGKWEAEEKRFADYAYDVLGADTTTYRVYRDGEGREIFLFIGYFGSQKYGGQIHSPRHCLPGGGWTITSREKRVIDEGLPVNLMKITLDPYTQLMWYWFETRGGSTRSEYGLKLDLVINSLQLKPTDAAFIRINLITEETPEETERIGEAFATELLKYLDVALPFTDRGKS